MADSIVIASNATRARILNADRKIKLLAHEHLSYIVEGAEHTDAYVSGRWDGRSSFFEFKNAMFPAGFVSTLADHLRSKGYTVRTRRKKLPAPLGPELQDAYEAVNPHGVDPRYDYQLETVRRLEKYGQMIAQVATGGGKSMIACTAVKRIMRPTLFITTRQALMYQMKAGFEQAGFRVGVLGDGEWCPVKGVNVAMVQTIAQRLSSDREGVAEKMQKLLSLFEFVILEEAHEAGSNSYFDVLNALPNALYRLSLTATPFMRSDEEANMRLMAVSGEVGIRVTEKMLIEREILARPIFKYVRPEFSKDLYPHSNWQKAYKLGIVEGEDRNAHIVYEVNRARKYGLTSMILVQRKAHGESLKSLLKEHGVRAEFLEGKHDAERRQRGLDRLKTGKIDALIGTTILDVGVDVPAVGMVVLAGGGKAEIGLRQRIGRGLRAKKDGPNVCLVLDFEDNKNKHLREHARTRRAIVEATPGFAENILGKGEDFPYEDLGFKMKEMA